LRLQVAREGAGGQRDIADSSFDEVSAERGLRKDSDIGPRIEGINLRKNPSQTGEVGSVVALSRLELNDSEMNRTIHPSEVAIAQRYNQPLRALVVAALVFTPALAGAQQPANVDSVPWTIVPMPQASLVLARDGSLIGEIGKEIRTSVSIKSLPKYLAQAFVAVEDHRFYQHDGVDVVGIAGALKDNIFGERRGASTITQQLVGNMHPTLIDRTDMSLGRKLSEQAAAREMEKHYTKEQILEGYLNQISFGHGWYGVESAARHYFGKSASRLTLAEAAALAAMPKGPALYDPLKYPDRVRQRRNVVLALMADQGFITGEQAKNAQASRLTTSPNGGYSAYSPWFVDVVRVQATRAGIPVTQGGYRIYTSLDPVLQNAATSALAEETAALESQPDYAHPRYAPPKPGARSTRTTDYLQGMVVAMDPTSGDVKALVGGRDYSDSQFDRAVDGMRQPGSSFKPIVYSSALDNGYTPSTVVVDAPIEIDLGQGAGVWRPENYSTGKYRGPTTLRNALRWSLNTVTVRLAQDIGMPLIGEYAKRFGVYDELPNYLSYALGAGETTVMRMVTAYSMFANGGRRVKSTLIDRIQDRYGRTIFKHDARECRGCDAPGGWKNQPEPQLVDRREQVLDSMTAYQITSMMEGVVQAGTATVVKEVGKPIAGKTGTTNDEKDAWFIGFSPDIVVGIYMGYDKPRNLGKGATGGHLAAPIARDFLKLALVDKAAIPFKVPAGIKLIRVDQMSGMRAGPGEGGRTILEAFKPGTAPPDNYSVIGVADADGRSLPPPDADRSLFLPGTGRLY